MAQRYPTAALPSNPDQPWLDELPWVVDELVSVWELELGKPYVPGGQCAWVANGDPLELARGMAELLEVDPERVRLWLFARCAQEALHNQALRDPARRLAP